MKYLTRGADRRPAARPLRANRRPSAVHATAAALALLAGAALSPLVPANADSGVQRIEFRDLPVDTRAVERAASQVRERQALINQAAELEFDARPAADAEIALAGAVARGHPVAQAATLALDLGRSVAPDQVAARQVAIADDLRLRADLRADEAETSIRRLGLNPRLIAAKTGRAAQGGPLQGGARGLGAPFERLAASLARMEGLEGGLASIPHNLPASLQYISSGFGYRSDPFTGEAAMHAGLDFRGPVGAPIYAAAAGRITFAGVKNGYGNCIEISHGNGMLTRYAHMSAFKAHVGDTVASGDTIGAIGSTGRSTGPHLHFEVRINDQPVNPRPFLEAAGKA